MRKLFLSLLMVATSAFLGCDTTTTDQPGVIHGVVMQEGVGVNGVTVELSGDAHMDTTTDNDGQYSFESLDLGTYTVSPSKEFLTSTPERIDVILGENSPEATDVDFDVELISDNPNAGCEERVWRGDYVILSFLGIYPLMGYTEITGNLTISGTTAFNLRGLDCLKHVGGSLTIAGNALNDLSGLDNLTSIGRHLTISGNAFVSLDGLESLQSVGGSLTITTTSFLNMNALSNLTSVDNISIIANPTLLSLKGLNGITDAGNVTILANPLITSSSGLENLKTVNGFLFIRDNTYLSSLGLTSLESVDNNFSVIENINLCTNLAEELADGISVGGTVNITANKICP